MPTIQLTAHSDIDNPKHYLSKPCERCGTATRYKSTRQCIQCDKEYRKRNREKYNDVKRSWANRNPDKDRQCKRAWDAENKEHKKAYANANREKINEYQRGWAHANRDKTSAKCARNRAQRKNADVYPEFNWVNKFFYQEAKTLEHITGYKWHVDHIVPLQGKTVCGLHVPWNLQTIPANDNLSKSNIFMSN
jgi:hypothetical protein